MNFQTISNNITTYFNILANANSWIVRYDNDPRSTPNNISWSETNIDFGESQQYEIGIDSYRITGIFIVMIHTNINIGISDGLGIANIIVNNFTNLILENGVRFQVPKIKNVGRVDNMWQINVVCPFVCDTN